MDEPEVLKRARQSLDSGDIRQWGLERRVAAALSGTLSVLQAVGPDLSEDLSIDFIGGAVGYRLRSGEGRGQPLARAVGLKTRPFPAIVDATAGMGRDAFFLASLGADVTLIERSPQVHAALAAALERARNHSEDLAAIVARMTLLHGDSRKFLPDLAPEIVLVDPMHPERSKSALVKKQMRDLRDVVGADTDAHQLLEVALASATRRVVLKWPLRAAAIPGLRAPSHQIVGKTTRYDVFVVG
ncbi:MAG TPA: class I SAM-dependent methyltransferase [Pelagibacterium sp.]|uniref:class I SAM-dependent methyltransferase n=1 Tax=Pelagibacterium sp. TaxID=1967288 RepID=UPI002C5398F7|nr:class I SAM-dependent methyltransferase [Pelagibacterium sp.]HWJ89137.1 class I SAM-dependent methyltransferase [Pelagibacterium sp.]